MSYTFGYVRVSSVDQNEDRQVQKMLELGIEERFIFVDKQSGKNFDRPGYQTMRGVIREGDLVYVDSIDRLGRDYDGIIKEWKYITRDIKADIVVLENSSLFDSRQFRSMGEMGKLMEDQFLSLLSFVADQERKKIRKRQEEGIALAKKNGRQLGRPKMNLSTISSEQKKLLASHFLEWKNQEITGVEFMKLLGVKKDTFYKLAKEFEGSRDGQALISMLNNETATTKEF
ncbi:recombinase family protein [Thermoactinomyces sp. DSM 45892]|uniref:recombinase family protein n=1 Tax=Thermoactinomyces sp. DSM 45892 TaxID=1882753 RepID=UPI00089AE0A2|nr:recombinase family protein [Thermoactinomyces sp. DSM 45892]SDY86804.1 Site-specific DNA recombinase [Thermoactinomyces sp. DSM 45892]